MDTEALSKAARRLRDAFEPIAAAVYFSPEAHQAYERLGFGPSSGERDGVQMPDGPAYFTSRGAALGQVPGEVVAAAFGVFNPEIVVPLVAMGWQTTTREAILDARLEGSVGQLTRVLGEKPDGIDRATELLKRGAEAGTEAGHHLFAGLKSLGYPGDPMGDLWRAADLVREHRGDSHIAAWANADLDATEISLLTELYWGIPVKTYTRSRAWSDEQQDAALDRLRSRGLVTDGNEFTDEGRRVREQVEVDTDRQERRIIEAIGEENVDELCGILEPWDEQIRAAGGYPKSVKTVAGR